MTLTQKNTLYLVDVSSFIFRAFYAVRELRNRRGEPTNAIYGVATMLARLIEEAKPEYISIVYDSKEPSFRKVQYDAYKANRSAPPEDLRPQFDQIEKMIGLMKLHSIRHSGVEADDLIATLTKQWIEADPAHEVIIVTGDKDLMQLVTSRVRAWDTMKGVLYSPKEVEEKFGVPPNKVRDYLSLVGDSSDNIPGVPSIGPKGAVDLLKDRASLAEVIEAAKRGEIPGKKGETLRAHEAEANLSYTLVTLKEDVQVPFSVSEMQSPFPEGKVRVEAACLSLLKDFDFHSLVAKWSGGGASDVGTSGVTDPRASTGGADSGVTSETARANTAESPAPGNFFAKTLAPGKFTGIFKEAELLELISRMEKAGEFSFDLETTSLNPRAAEIAGISIAVDREEGFYIPVGHRGSNLEQLPEKWVLEKLKGPLQDPKIKIIGQNLKYDLSVLYAKGIEVDGVGADTMVADYVLDPEGKHNLDTLARKYFDYTTLSFEEVCGKGKSQIPFDLVPIETAIRYSGEDAWITLNLWREMQPRILREGLMQIFAEVDMPLVKVLMEMEAEGVSIDVPYLKNLSHEFSGRIHQIDQEIQALTGRTADRAVNLNSPKQLAELLFNELKLPTQSKTKTGFSTDASVLETLAPLHPVPRLILEHRELAKLLGTYIDPLPLQRDEKTGRIHGGFHQAVTATGRLSSSDPNLQNIPVRTEKGQKIRRSFIPSPGNVFLSADYSQIELRLLAEMSGDPELVRSFKSGEDVHRRTASEIFGNSVDEVTEEQRGVAKAINFGLMYGKTAFGLAQELGISRSEAKDRIDRYFTRYRGVKNYLDTVIVNAAEKGSVGTLLGRKRVLRDIRSKNAMMRQAAERLAMNTPIQGTAADLMKCGMIRVQEGLKKLGGKAKMIIQVHDEVVIDCPKGEVAAVRAMLVDALEHAFAGKVEIQVPLKVNIAEGVNWMDLD
jgi:DNA polymerase I